MNKKFLRYLEIYNYKIRYQGSHFILYNPKIGDVFQSNKEILDHFINSVIEKKYSENEEDKVLKDLFQNKHKKRDKKANIPFHIQWHINENCNLRCKHCYQEGYLHEGLSLTEMKKIVDKYFIAIKKWNNTPEFSITGGEPFLNKNLFSILKYIKSKNKNTRIAILTNGTLINKKTIEKIKEIGVNLIQLSLEGSTKELNDEIRGEGVYEKVISSIKVLKKNNIRTGLHFVISRKNKNDVIEYIKLAKRVKVNILTFSTLIPFGSGKEMKELILSPRELKETYFKIDKEARELDKKNDPLWIRRTRPLWCLFPTEDKKRPVGGLCPVGINTLTILSDGKVMPCRRFPLIIGDLKNQNFFEIWYESEVLWDIRNKDKIDGCGKCKFINRCGGCRGLAYVFFNDYMGPDPQCWLVNQELGDYYEKRRAF